MDRGNLGTCWLGGMLIALALAPGSTYGQSNWPTQASQDTPPAGATTSHLPEPIIWKQNRFFIPYQWSGSADPSAAQAVWLFVSKDGGQSWQKISEAQPNVRGFTYHAERDGEYLFSIRTIDRHGTAWPAGPHRAELRVEVDTTLPRIEQLAGRWTPEGQLEIAWQATDVHLDPENVSIEVKLASSTTWQRLEATQRPAGQGVIGHVVWPAPAPPQPASLRLTVYDLAGNRSVRGAEVTPGTADDAPQPYPTIISGRGDQTENQPNEPGHSNLFPPPDGQSNHRLSQPAGSLPLRAEDDRNWQQSGASSGGMVKVAPQVWPADNQPAHSTSNQGGAPLTTQNPFVSTQPEQQERARPSSSFAAFGANARTDTQPTSDAYTTTSPPARSSSPATIRRGPPIDPLEPYRAARGSDEDPTAADNADRHPARTGSGSQGVDPFKGMTESATTSTSRVGMTADDSSSWTVSTQEKWLASFGVRLPDGVEPRLVNATTFELEYDLESVGRWGVARVELWGTRDGGKTWRSYAIDPDHRSPLRAHVEGEGLYGFRIVVQSAGGPAAYPPRPGETPELWVAVDLTRPQARLDTPSQGAGNLADHLIVRWQAEDANIDPRPIALFYSSSPSGPWSAVATGLENTGEYAWRLERHLPSQFYLRLEVRDAAGNLAADQTSEPVILNRPQPTGRLRGVRPVIESRANSSTHR